MNDQKRLFELAVEAISIQAIFVPGEGWRVQVASRRQGDTWGSTPWETYSGLSSPEFDEVVAQELPRRLRLV